MNTVESPIESVSGWYHLLPFGEFKNDETGAVQVIDQAAMERIVSAFEQDQDAQNHAGRLVDQEHFSYDLAKSTEARGWIKDMQIRKDGLWVQIELTDLGETELANRRYKFLSAAFMPNDLEQLGGRRVRPVRLDTAAFTNRPRMKQLAPMTNRGGGHGAGSAGPGEVDVNLTAIASETLALLASREPGSSFDNRWHAVNARYPILNRAASGTKVYFNRAYDPDIILNPQDRALVEEGEKILREKYRASDHWKQQMRLDIPLFVRPVQLLNYTRQALNRIQQHGNFPTLEAAFDHLKEVHPLLFLNACYVAALPEGHMGRLRPPDLA